MGSIRIDRRAALPVRGREVGAILLEVLIAVTLVGLLMVAISTSLGIGLRAMERSNAKLELNRRIQRTQEILEQQLLHLMPASAACMLRNPQAPETVMFFDGQPTQMRFLSSYSLSEAGRGYPRILEFLVAPGDGRRANPGVRLLVNEILYTGPMMAGQLCFGRVFNPMMGTETIEFTPVTPNPGSFILLDRLQAARFRYLEYREPPQAPAWVERWGRPVYPEAIAIDVIPLPDANAGLQPMSLVLPLRIDRIPGKKYED